MSASVEKKAASLIDESDRGCVLVAGFILDRALERAFETIFRRNGMSKSLISGMFDQSGPLATFSAKIRLAYGMDLIPRPVFDDLERIRKLRNLLAHSDHEVDFLDPSVGGVVEKLNCCKEMPAMQRYSPSGEVPKPRDAHMRATGYVKYAKSMFCLGIVRLEGIILVEALKYLKRYPRPQDEKGRR